MPPAICVHQAAGFSQGMTHWEPVRSQLKCAQRQLANFSPNRSIAWQIVNLARTKHERQTWRVQSRMPRLYSPGPCRGNMPAGHRSSSLWGVTQRCLAAKMPLRPWLLEGWAYIGGVAAGISLYATGAPAHMNNHKFLSKYDIAEHRHLPVCHAGDYPARVVALRKCVIALLSCMQTLTCSKTVCYKTSKLSLHTVMSCFCAWTGLKLHHANLQA